MELALLRGTGSAGCLALLVSCALAAQVRVSSAPGVFIMVVPLL